MENSNSPFDSEPRPRMTEEGLSDAHTKDPYTQWKNWHMSDRVREQEYTE